MEKKYIGDVGINYIISLIKKLFVKKSDIVDNLTTESTDKGLSANQGVVIQKSIETIDEKLDSHGHNISDITNLKEDLDSKQDKITGAATSVIYNDLVPSKVLISSTTGKICESPVDASYFNSVDYSKLLGLTSSVQDQLNSKLSATDFDINMTNYYTKTEIDNLELITVDDIDAICGTTIQNINEVTF